MRDLYESLTEKTALSTRARYALGGAAIGGAVGAGAGYLAPGDDNVRRNPDAKRNAAILGGVTGGLIGGAAGLDVGRHRQADESWRRYRESVHEARQADPYARGRAEHIPFWNDLAAQAARGEVTAEEVEQRVRDYFSKHAAHGAKTFGGLTFTIDRPKGYVKEWPLSGGGVKRFVYPVDYGYLPSHNGEDGEGLDFFVGGDEGGHLESFQKLKRSGDERGYVLDETKFLVGVTDGERELIYALYGPEVWHRKRYVDMDELRRDLPKFRAGHKARYAVKEATLSQMDLYARISQEKVAFRGAGGAILGGLVGGAGAYATQNPAYQTDWGSVMRGAAGGAALGGGMHAMMSGRPAAAAGQPHGQPAQPHAQPQAAAAPPKPTPAHRPTMQSAGFQPQQRPVPGQQPHAAPPGNPAQGTTYHPGFPDRVPTPQQPAQQPQQARAQAPAPVSGYRPNAAPPPAVQGYQQNHLQNMATQPVAPGGAPGRQAPPRPATQPAAPRPSVMGGQAGPYGTTMMSGPPSMAAAPGAHPPISGVHPVAHPNGHVPSGPMGAINPQELAQMHAQVGTHFAPKNPDVEVINGERHSHPGLGGLWARYSPEGQQIMSDPRFAGRDARQMGALASMVEMAKQRGMTVTPDMAHEMMNSPAYAHLLKAGAYEKIARLAIDEYVVRATAKLATLERYGFKAAEMKSADIQKRLCGEILLSSVDPAAWEAAHREARARS